MNAHHTPSFRLPFFYGWIIVGTLFVVNFSTMATGTFNFGLFVIPMGVTLGASRSFFGWAQTVRLLTGGISSIFIGRLLDSYGPRFLIPTASLIIFVSMLTLAYINKPWHLLVLFGLIGITGLTAPGAMMSSVPTSKWFIINRGKALAWMTAGLGIGGIIFLPLTQLLIDNMGWRSTWIALAFCSIAISFPLSLIFLRRQPEDLGLHPDGISSSSVRHTKLPYHPQELDWTVSDAMQTKTFWRLIAFFFLLGLAAGLSDVHRVPYWIEQGFRPQTVSYAMASDAALAALSIFVSGFLLDRFPSKNIAISSCIGFFFATNLMIVAANSFFLFSSAMLWGLSVGIHMMVMSFIWADYFGRAFAGSIRGVVLPASLIAAGVGSPLAGYIYQINNNYMPVWWSLFAIYILAAWTITTVRLPIHPNTNSQLR
jgi:MFS family permease